MSNARKAAATAGAGVDAGGADAAPAATLVPQPPGSSGIGRVLQLWWEGTDDQDELFADAVAERGIAGRRTRAAAAVKAPAARGRGRRPARSKPKPLPDTGASDVSSDSDDERIISAKQARRMKRVVLGPPPLRALQLAAAADASGAAAGATGASVRVAAAAAEQADSDEDSDSDVGAAGAAVPAGIALARAAAAVKRTPCAERWPCW